MWRRDAHALWRLTKPGITLANTLMIALGLAAGGWGHPRALSVLLGGAALVASSAVANMILERARDGLMHRTAARPLPSGQLGLGLALCWSAALGLLAARLLWVSSPTALGVGLLGWVLYVFIYTPLKPRSSWSLFAGALAGAMPPMMGALAVDAPASAWALGLMLGAWQLPHVVALVLLHRQDYLASGLALARVPTPTLVALARGGATLCCLSAGLVATRLGLLGWLLPLASAPALIAALRSPTAPRWAAKVFGHGFWLFLCAPLVIGAVIFTR